MQAAPGFDYSERAYVKALDAFISSVQSTFSQGKPVAVVVQVPQLLPILTIDKAFL